MDSGNGRASTYTECFQFFLAPTDLNGQNADPTKRPHVMNNSWGCPLSVPSNASGCGGIASIPNNHFGWGRVDALAAYNLEPSLEQSIALPAIADRQVGDADFTAGATARSGLDVSYTASGSSTVSGDIVHLTGPGACTVTASQAGIDVYGIAPSSPKPWYPAADVSRTFLVLYAGFAGLRPPFGVVNQPQAGSGFPVKFSLGGSYGLDVFAPGYPKSKACEAADATLASTAASEPFAYDSGQYRYVWKTERSWAGTCRDLVLRFADSTEQRARFELK